MIKHNADSKTVDGFGEECTRFDQAPILDHELRSAFEKYFSVFPWDSISDESEGFDLGCGSGRWGYFVAPRVGILHCIDASAEALSVAHRNLQSRSNCRFHHASVEDMPMADNSMDFGYSLGVLHHVPDTAAGIAACVRKLKRGAPLLLYLYYRFDNRPTWFQALWRASDLARKASWRLPINRRHVVSDVIAAGVYFPLATSARLFERLGLSVETFPLSAYRHQSFYAMRTDALDRFGTRLEQRFTKREIEDLLTATGLSESLSATESPIGVQSATNAELADDTRSAERCASSS